MHEYITIGFGFAFAAVIQPGPLQAYLLSSVSEKGWKHTLPVSLSPLISDGPIAVLALFVLSHVPEIMTRILQGAGGVFLIYLAWSSFKQWKNQVELATKTSDSVPRTLMQAVTVNLLNPNPYLGWSLVMGPAVVKAWHQDPIYSIALVLSFYITVITGLAITIILFGTTHFLGTRGRRTLILISSIALALLGIYFILASVLGRTT